MTDRVPFFDGHNDVLLRLVGLTDNDPPGLFLKGGTKNHIDLPKSVAGGLGGGFFAVFTPNRQKLGGLDDAMNGKSYDVPLPPEVPYLDSLPHVMAMAALLFRIERRSEGKVKVCRTAKEISDCLERGVLAAVLHIEGTEAIDNHLNALEVLYQAGLRSLGPVWSRPNRFGHGVPFRYPSTPDIGRGLTDLGKDLVRACNELGVMVDLSHLNEAGFWDVAQISDAPLVATHSNAHAICPHARNLTDKQLDAIRDTGGMVGINFATSFLRPDGQTTEDTSLDTVLRHVDYLVQRVGIDSVGFGSDFDGATIPGEIGTAAGLGSLRDAMVRHGYDGPTLNQLCHGNWVRVLERTWGG